MCRRQKLWHLWADSTLQNDNLSVYRNNIYNTNAVDSLKYYLISFLGLGKERTWNVSRLEDALQTATERLSPEAIQKCTIFFLLLMLLSLHWKCNGTEYV